MTGKLGLGARLYRAMTFPLRMLPDFLIIGAARAGTTSLYRYLSALPGVGPALRKEVHYFDLHYQRATAVYRYNFPSQLDRFFALRRGAREFITGESSPYYLFHPDVPRRVKKLVPRVKLIALLRNPVKRAYSHYHLQVRAGIETLSFQDAIDREEERLQGETERLLADEKYFGFNHQHYSYLARGIYIDQLNQWLEFFPREQLLILKSEDLYGDTQATMRRVMDFLNLSSGTPSQSYRKHNAGEYAPLDGDVRRRLVAYFEPHNRRLYDWLGMDFGWNS